MVAELGMMVMVVVGDRALQVLAMGTIHPR